MFTARSVFLFRTRQPWIFCFVVGKTKGTPDQPSKKRTVVPRGRCLHTCVVEVWTLSLSLLLVVFHLSQTFTSFTFFPLWFCDPFLSLPLSRSTRNLCPFSLQWRKAPLCASRPWLRSHRFLACLCSPHSLPLTNPQFLILLVPLVLYVYLSKLLQIPATFSPTIHSASSLGAKVIAVITHLIYSFLIFHFPDFFLISWKHCDY